MHEKLENLVNFLKWLNKDKFTGQVRLNFHMGELSEKIDIKQSNFFAKLLKKSKKQQGDMVTFEILKDLK